MSVKKNNAKKNTKKNNAKKKKVNAGLPLESKNRTCTYILAWNFGHTCMLLANGNYTDNFGHFSYILRT